MEKKQNFKTAKEIGKIKGMHNVLLIALINWISYLYSCVNPTVSVTCFLTRRQGDTFNAM